MRLQAFYLQGAWPAQTLLSRNFMTAVPSYTYLCQVWRKLHQFSFLIHMREDFLFPTTVRSCCRECTGDASSMLKCGANNLSTANFQGNISLATCLFYFGVRHGVFSHQLGPHLNRASTLASGTSPNQPSRQRSALFRVCLRLTHFDLRWTFTDARTILMCV